MAAINKESRSNLAFMEGSLNAQAYPAILTENMFVFI